MIFLTNVFYILTLDLQTWERGRFSESSNSGDSGISHKKYSLSATIQKYYFFSNNSDILPFGNHSENSVLATIQKYSLLAIIQKYSLSATIQKYSHSGKGKVGEFRIDM